MNERILELAKQCGYWSGQTIEMNDVGIKKFAELIVRECIEVLNKRFMGDLNREDHEVRRCIKDLKDLFGVIGD